MKKRTAFIGAILSLIPLGQPLLFKTGIILFSSSIIITHPEQLLANSFNYDYQKALKIFREGNYNKAILQFSEMLKQYPDTSTEWKSLIYLYLSMSYGYLKKHYAELEFINKAIDLNPNVDIFYLQRSMSKGSLGDKKGSCSDLLIAKDLGSKDAKDYFEKWGCN